MLRTTAEAEGEVMAMSKTGLSPPVICVTNRSKAILLWLFFLFYVLVFKNFVLLAPYVCFHIFS